MRKKIVFISIIISILIFVSGCVSIETGTYMHNNGSISRVYRVIIDSNTPNINQVKERVIFELEGLLALNTPEYGEIIIDDNNEYDIRLVYTYPSMTEYNIAMGLTGDEAPLEDNSLIEKDILYIYTTTDMFSGYDKDYIFEYIDYYNYKYQGDMDIEDLNLAFEYGTKYTKVYIDSNADYVEMDNGMKVFRWELKASDVDSPKLLIAKQPNSGNWYIISIGASLVLCVVMVVIVKVKGKMNARD